MRTARAIAIAALAALLFDPAPAAAQGSPRLSQARAWVSQDRVPLLRPVPGASVPEAVWDSLTALDGAQRHAFAESVATSYVERIERSPAPDSLELSRMVFHAAVARLKQKRYADGVGFARLERGIGIRTRHAPPGDLLLAWAHVYAGLPYSDAIRYEATLEHAAIAGRLLRALDPPDTTLLSANWLAIAVANGAYGRIEPARAAYDSALRLREASLGRMNHALIPTLAEYGLFLSRAADFDGARVLLRRAVEIGVSTRNAPTNHLEGALTRLSTVENQAGNVGESIDLVQRALELVRRRTGDHGVATARVRTMLAYRLEQLGDYEGVVALLAAAVPEMSAALGAGNPQTLNARLAWSRCLLLGGDTSGVADQLEGLRSAVAAQSRMSNSNVVAYLQLVALLERARGNEAAARETLAIAVRGEWEKRDPKAANLTALLVDQMAGARSAADGEWAARVGRDVDRMGDSTLARAGPAWAEALAARAAAEARVGMHEAAWRDALEAERLSRERFGYQLQALPDERALQLSRQLGDACDLLVRLARPEVGNEVTEAWDRLLKWRGRVRYEVARRRAPVAAHADTALAGMHARWIAAQRRLGQAVVSGGAHPDDPETAERFHSARHEAEVAESRYLGMAGIVAAPESTLSLDAVLARLKPDQSLAAFALGSHGPGDATLGVFVANGADRKARWIPLGPLATAEAEIGAWMDCIARPPAGAADARRGERACRELGGRVRARLWSPIEQLSGDAREILIVPEGPIAGVPWLALPEVGSGYLAEGSRSIRVLDAERELLAPESPATGQGLLAIADPDYEQAGKSDGPALAVSVRARTWPCAGGDPVAMPALPGTRAEIEGIARGWPTASGPARLLLGAEATESQLKHEAPGHEVIHVATHGVVVRDTCHARAGAGIRGVGGLEPVAGGARSKRRPSKAAAAPPPPSQSTRWLGGQVWLALAGANRTPASGADENEGLLTAEEVVTLDLRGVRWVVLSACQTGLGTGWAREGVLGMRRAFHLAGARAVIASQWPVADEATREWMHALYAARRPEGGASEAAASASRAVLEARRRDRRPTHPFYWAAFTTSGE